MFTGAGEMRISKKGLRVKLLQFSGKDMKCTSSQAPQAGIAIESRHCQALPLPGIVGTADRGNRYENIDKED